MIACGLGRITQGTVGPTAGRWPRLVEIILDGLRAKGLRPVRLDQLLGMPGYLPTC